MNAQGSSFSTATTPFDGIIDSDYLRAFNVHLGTSNSKNWIVDSGASEHMTGNISLLHDFHIKNHLSTVRVANGAVAKVLGTGSAYVTSNICLTNVLYVPNLDCNLLSIRRICHDLKCHTKFYPYDCEFQDADTGRMIGNAKLCSGLYVLQPSPPIENASGYSISLPNKRTEIMLWHRRLGHPSFLYLAKIFPKLFINEIPSSFHCDICQFTKHTRTPYPSIAYKPSKSFSLIHNDV